MSARHSVRGLMSWWGELGAGLGIGHARTNKSTLGRSWDAVDVKAALDRVWWGLGLPCHDAPMVRGKRATTGIFVVVEIRIASVGSEGDSNDLE
jgi:hypothetical protein